MIVRLLELPFILIYRTIRILLKVLGYLARHLGKIVSAGFSHLLKLTEHLLKAIIHLLSGFFHLLFRAAHQLFEVTVKIMEKAVTIPAKLVQSVVRGFLSLLRVISKVISRTFQISRQVGVGGSVRLGRYVVLFFKQIGKGIVLVVKAPLHVLLRIVLVGRRLLVALNLVDDIVLLPTMPFFKIQRKKRR